ncbi:MAG: DUF5615 family PIN-like protein [Myxococcota bacterium]
MTEHVLDLQRTGADDPDIWHRAVSQNRAPISKDEDFLHLANRPGSTGVFVWVRLGNCRKQVLLASSALCLHSSRLSMKVSGSVR